MGIIKKKWQPVIGLEIHAQLRTKSKLFSGASTAYGALPNTQACLIDLGYPGVLPVFNQQTLEFAIRFGLAIGATIEPRCIFARKNYFYPDLPKGYQISQFDHPIVSAGCVEVARKDGSVFQVNIERAHLEEDAGKSVHDRFEGQTGVDLNRSGVPLIEIVSKPDMFSIDDAVSYAKWIHTLMQYLEICDGNMQEGSFRCDANVSVRPVDSTVLGTRAEIKNLNSFRFLAKAIDYEIERQIELIESGEKVMQETRLYDAESVQTRSMRSKENANDYRYFADPDLLPVTVTSDFIEKIKQTLPELPDQKKDRFQKDYGLGAYEAAVLVSEKPLAAYFEQVAKAVKPTSYILAANWVMMNLLGFLNKNQLSIEQSPVKPEHLAQLLDLIEQQVISTKIAKSVFEIMAQTGEKPAIIVEKQGLKQVSDERAIEKVVCDVIEQNPQQLEQYRAGKDKLFGFFVGQVMKATQGKANPQTLNELLKKYLAD